jgi:hypothetical protein
VKRSTKVALTLMVPAMTAFGCGTSAPVNQVGSHQTATDCDTPAKPGEPEKPKCTPTTSSHGSHYGPGYRSSRGSWFGPIFGGSHSSGVSSSHGSSSSSHVSHGGFGSSGSHFSSGG